MPQGRGGRVLMLLIQLVPAASIGLFFGGIAAMLGQLPWDPEPTPPGVMVFWGVLGAAIGVVLMQFLHRKVILELFHRSFEQRRLREGVCPFCSSALRGVQPAPDGCSLCPHCGAAWRLGQ